jgi:uncharacterized protein (UPF0335 family)
MIGWPFPKIGSDLDVKGKGEAVPTGIDLPLFLKEIIMSAVAADQLRLFIERIERLEEEKRGLNDDIKDVYAEAKANGYDTKTMRVIVRLRRMETQARNEADAILETYRAALGIAYGETPIERAIKAA